MEISREVSKILTLIFLVKLRKRGKSQENEEFLWSNFPGFPQVLDDFPRI